VISDKLFAMLNMTCEGEYSNYSDISLQYVSLLHSDPLTKSPHTFSNKTIIYAPAVIKCRCIPQSLWNCILSPLRL